MELSDKSYKAMNMHIRQTIVKYLERNNTKIKKITT